MDWRFLIGTSVIGAIATVITVVRSYLTYTGGGARRLRELLLLDVPTRKRQAWTIAHKTCFAGRSAVVQQLAKRCEESPFSVLIGEAGVGKSALVAEGLLPELERRGKVWPVFVPDLNGPWLDGPMARVLSAVPHESRLGPQRTDAEPADRVASSDIVRASLRNVEAVTGRRACVILDQVDDYVLSNAREFVEDSQGITRERLHEKNPFWSAVHELIRDGHITCLLVTRTSRPEGFTALLIDDPLAGFQEFLVPRLKRDEAQEVISALCAAYPNDGPPRVLTDAILDDLTTDEQLVLPMQVKTVLQACCALGIRSGASYSRKGADAIIRMYLEQELSDAAGKGTLPRSVVAAMLARMVSVSGHSRPVDVSEIIPDPSTSARRLAALDSLRASEILVAVERNWKLYNDFFCQPVLKLKRRHVDITQRVTDSATILKDLSLQTMQRAALPFSWLCEAVWAKAWGDLDDLPASVIVASVVGLILNARFWSAVLLALAGWQLWLQRLDSQAVDIVAYLDETPALSRRASENLYSFETASLHVQRRTTALFVQPAHVNAVRAQMYPISLMLTRLPVDRQQSLRQTLADACRAVASEAVRESTCEHLHVALGGSPSPDRVARALVDPSWQTASIVALLAALPSQDRPQTFSLAIRAYTQSPFSTTAGLCDLLQKMGPLERMAALHEVIKLGGSERQLAYLFRWRLLPLLTCAKQSAYLTDLIALAREAADGVTSSQNPRDALVAARLFSVLPDGLFLASYAQTAAQDLLDRASRSAGTPESVGYLEALGPLTAFVSGSTMDKIVRLVSTVIRNARDASELHRAVMMLPFDPALVSPIVSSEIAGLLAARILSASDPSFSAGALSLSAVKYQLFGSNERCQLARNALERLRRNPNDELAIRIAVLPADFVPALCVGQADWRSLHPRLVRIALSHGSEDAVLRGMVLVGLERVGRDLGPAAADTAGRTLTNALENRPSAKDWIVDLILTLPPAFSGKLAFDAIHPSITPALHKSQSTESRQVSRFATHFYASLSADERRRFLKALVNLTDGAPPDSPLAVLTIQTLVMSNPADRAEVWSMLYPQWRRASESARPATMAGEILATLTDSLVSHEIPGVVNDVIRANRQYGARQCAVAAGLVRPKTVVVIRRSLLDAFTCNEDEHLRLRERLSLQGAVLF